MAHIDGVALTAPAAAWLHQFVLVRLVPGAPTATGQRVVDQATH